MSLYEMIFQDGRDGLPLLAALGFKTVGDVGRYRSSWIEKADDNFRVAIYTRNGGGNRECWCWDSAAHDDHVHIERRTNVWSQGYIDEHGDEYHVKVLRPATNKDRRDPDGFFVVERDVQICDVRDSAECSCVGCLIEHRLPQHPGYLFDQDDDFDSTYATIYFAVPEGPLLDAIKQAEAEGVEFPVVDMSERWTSVIDALKASVS